MSTVYVETLMSTLFNVVVKIPDNFRKSFNVSTTEPRSLSASCVKPDVTDAVAKHVKRFAV